MGLPFRHHVWLACCSQCNGLLLPSLEDFILKLLALMFNWENFWWKTWNGHQHHDHDCHQLHQGRSVKICPPSPSCHQKNGRKSMLGINGSYCCMNTWIPLKFIRQLNGNENEENQINSWKKVKSYLKNGKNCFFPARTSNI